MDKLDFQETYWDSVATKKTFSHPINIDQFREVVLSQNKILDYGCGYGRTCAELIKNGYSADIEQLRFLKKRIYYSQISINRRDNVIKLTARFEIHVMLTLGHFVVSFEFSSRSNRFSGIHENRMNIFN